MPDRFQVWFLVCLISIPLVSSNSHVSEQNWFQTPFTLVMKPNSGQHSASVSSDTSRLLDTYHPDTGYWLLYGIRITKILSLIWDTYH